jgi:hypothetical protein
MRIGRVISGTHTLERRLITVAVHADEQSRGRRGLGAWSQHESQSKAMERPPPLPPCDDEMDRR